MVVESACVGASARSNGSDMRHVPSSTGNATSCMHMTRVTRGAVVEAPDALGTGVPAAWGV